MSETPKTLLWSNAFMDLHVQGLLSFGSFILGAVPHHSVALCQIEVECDEGTMLHAQCTQSWTINLENKPTQDKSKLVGH